MHFTLVRLRVGLYFLQRSFDEFHVVQAQVELCIVLRHTAPPIINANGSLTAGYRGLKGDSRKKVNKIKEFYGIQCAAVYEAKAFSKAALAARRMRSRTWAAM